MEMGSVSLVGIATHYGLDGPGGDFSTNVQTGPGAQTAVCMMGAVPLSRRWSGWVVALTTHPSKAEVKERV